MTEPRVTALGARVHLFVHPQDREHFISLFRDVLGCDTVERDFGFPFPIFLVSFEDGSAFSAEFTDRAPRGAGDTVDDATAFRGAWMEFRTADVPAVHERLRAAGIPEFRHEGSPHVYFSAPGGQVFRLLDESYTGP